MAYQAAGGRGAGGLSPRDGPDGSGYNYGGVGQQFNSN